MEGNKTLIVLGATGNQGGAVLRHFASQPNHLGYKLRGITRNVASKASLELSELGVEMVKADLEDADSLQRAFEGATHIFANTDSNQLIAEALKHPEKLAAGQTAPQYGVEYEKRHGANIIKAAASTSSLQRIVWSSIPSPVRESKGKYTKVIMWDSKEEITDMIKASEQLRPKLSTLMVGFYAANALKQPMLHCPTKQADGVYQLSYPMSGNTLMPMIDLDEDLGRFVVALFNANPGTTLIAASETLPIEQWVSLWGKHNNVPTRFHNAPPAEFARELGDFQGPLIEMLQYMDQFGFAGDNTEVMYPEQFRKAGGEIETSSIAAHIQRSDWSHLL